MIVPEVLKGSLQLLYQIKLEVLNRMSVYWLIPLAILFYIGSKIYQIRNATSETNMKKQIDTAKYEDL